ncbi:MAG: hypothetical protein LC662_06035, partial [Rhodothermaceae bacterium]|nr:hypothetical protein [Rhodothermaceae bacterium]
NGDGDGPGMLSEDTPERAHSTGIGGGDGDGGKIGNGNDRAEAGKKEKTNGNGTGIANVRRQLELIYPGRHQLDISTSDEIYSVELTIKQDPL